MKQLTVGLIAGPHRDRARRALDSLQRQSIADRLTVHLVDTEPQLEAIVPSDPVGIDVKVTDIPRDSLIGSARALAVREANTPLTGFLEEHAVAHPRWAEALVKAHEDPKVAATAGVIVNLDSEPLLAKVAALASYRASLPPIRNRDADVLFGQNVCYKRRDLMPLGQELDHYLTTELILFRLLRDQGKRLQVVPEAAFQHAGLAHYKDVLHGVYHYDRAAFGLHRRLGGGSGIVDYSRTLLSPLARTLKTLAAETRLRGLPLATLGCLPFTLLLHTAAAWGQFRGRAAGSGNSPYAYSSNELNPVRTHLPAMEV